MSQKWNFDTEIIPFFNQALDEKDRERRILSYECMARWIDANSTGKDCPPELYKYIQDEIVDWLGEELDVDEEDERDKVLLVYTEMLDSMARYNYGAGLDEEFVKILFAVYSSLLPFGVLCTPFDVDIYAKMRAALQKSEKDDFGYVVQYDGLNSKVLFVPKGKSWIEIGDNYQMVLGS